MSSDSTRWSILRRAAAGVPEDQTEFARRYEGVIRAYLRARWRGTPLLEELEDAAQQVFIDCLKENGALAALDPERGSGFRPFLFGVVRNVARATERKHARSRERQSPSSVDLEMIAAREESFATAFDREWARGVLRQAAELYLSRARQDGPEAVQRHRLLELRYGEGLPIRAIAARWGVDAALLHREFPKARDEFKRSLLDVVRDLDGLGSEALETECARLLAFFS